MQRFEGLSDCVPTWMSRSSVEITLLAKVSPTRALCPSVMLA